MIEINLLPPEMRKVKAVAKPVALPGKFLLIPVLVIGGFFLFQIILQFFILINSLSIGRLTKDFNKILLRKKQVDLVKENYQKLKSFSDIVSALAKERMLVSGKLNSISDMIVPGVWLSELSLKSGELEIKGSCVSLMGQELAQIGKFLSSLKSLSSINKDFSRLELSSVDRMKIINVEIVSFYLSSKDVLKIQDGKSKKTGN